ncbi:unnamed protein product, partial [Ilex paraguariensis]
DITTALGESTQTSDIGGAQVFQATTPWKIKKLTFVVETKLEEEMVDNRFRQPQIVGRPLQEHLQPTWSSTLSYFAFPTKINVVAIKLGSILLIQCFVKHDFDDNKHPNMD